MNIDDILKMIYNLNFNNKYALDAIKNINYNDFNSEELAELKRRLMTFLDSLKPKFKINCWGDIVAFGIISIVMFAMVFDKMIIMLYGGLVLFDVGIDIIKYFKIKYEYSSEEIIKIIKDVIDSIDNILMFRRRKIEAIDLEEIKEVQSAKTSSKVVNHDLNYLYKLIECVNASLINLSGDYKVYVNLRFNDALKSLDSIDNQDSLEMVIAEFERIADIITEVQQEEQNLQNSETLKGEARS